MLTMDSRWITSVMLEARADIVTLELSYASQHGSGAYANGMCADMFMAQASIRVMLRRCCMAGPLAFPYTSCCLMTPPLCYRHTLL